jgi:hypothetical protein
VEQRNQRLVMIEGIGLGLVNGVAAFLAVFMVRLGASDLLIGTVNAIPSLTGMVLAVPVGEFLARKANIVPWYSRARLLVQCRYVLTGLVPFFFASHQPEVIMAILALATIPQTITAVALTAMMGAVAGPKGRFALASKRWSIFALVSALTTMAAGAVLSVIEFPLNYQVIFISAAVGGRIGYSQSRRIELPPNPTPKTGVRLSEMVQQVGGILRTNEQFVRFTASQFVYRWGLLLPVPLLPIYWVRNVHASDAAISAINATQAVTTVLGYFYWNRASRSGRERQILLASTLGLSLYPALTAFTHRVELLIVWATISGFFAAGVNLVFFDAMLKTAPAERQTTYVGLYQTTVYIAGLGAPLLATSLSTAVGIVPALVLGSVLCGAGFVLMAVLGVGKEEIEASENESSEAGT